MVPALFSPDRAGWKRERHEVRHELVGRELRRQRPMLEVGKQREADERQADEWIESVVASRPSPVLTRYGMLGQIDSGEAEVFSQLGQLPEGGAREERRIWRALEER